MTHATAPDAMLAVCNPPTGQADYRLAVSSRQDIADKAKHLRTNQREWVRCQWRRAAT